MFCCLLFSYNNVSKFQNIFLAKNYYIDIKIIYNKLSYNYVEGKKQTIFLLYDSNELIVLYVLLHFFSHWQNVLMATISL